MAEGFGVLEVEGGDLFGYGLDEVAVLVEHQAQGFEAEEIADHLEEVGHGPHGHVIGEIAVEPFDIGEVYLFDSWARGRIRNPARIGWARRRGAERWAGGQSGPDDAGGEDPHEFEADEFHDADFPAEGEYFSAGSRSATRSKRSQRPCLICSSRPCSK